MNLFICAWPANNLANAVSNVIQIYFVTLKMNQNYKYVRSVRISWGRRLQHILDEHVKKYYEERCVDSSKMSETRCRLRGWFSS